LALRPAIPAATNADTGAEEAFQTLTLRPLLKFQHALLCRCCAGHLAETKQSPTGKTPDQRTASITQCLTNKALHSTLLGMITGFFTDEEYSYYSLNRKAVNKRITSMLVARLVDGLPQ